LDLRATRLSGTVPTEVGELERLTYLFLQDTLLSGTLPPEIGNVYFLQTLRTFDTSLSGTLPPEIGDLAHLNSLHFGATYLSGALPSQLGKLSRLVVMLPYETSISGTLPSEFGKLSELAYLYLSDTSLSGTLPTELGANLGELDIGVTSMSGTLPSEMGMLTELTFLAVNATSLSGSLPTEVGFLASLQQLRFDQAYLSGSLPSELGDLAELQSLDLSSNRVSGTLPSQLQRLTSLQALILDGMSLEGTLPSPVFEMCIPFGECRCSGIPPFSCSAFGPTSRMSLESLHTCIKCPSRTQTWIGIIAAGLLLPIGAGTYIWLVNRSPVLFVKRWVATSAILLSYAQVVGLLASLSAVSSDAYNGLHLFLLAAINLAAIHPQCLWPQQPPVASAVGDGGYLTSGNWKGGILFSDFSLDRFLRSPSFIGPLVVLSVPLLMFFILNLAKLCTMRRHPWCWRIRCWRFWRFPDDDDALLQPLEQPHAPNAVDGAGCMADKLESGIIIVYTIQLPTACRVCIVNLPLGGVPLALASAVLLLEVLFFARLSLQLRRLQHFKFPPSGHAEGRARPLQICERLERRLHYLAERFQPHAMLWQLVVWARQILLIVALYAFDRVLEQVLATLAVLFVALALHLHVQPYVLQYQNRLETILASSSVLFVIAAYLVNNQLDASPISSWSVVAIPVLPASLYLVYLAAARWLLGFPPFRGQRNLLIFACSPKVAPLEEAPLEAHEVEASMRDTVGGGTDTVFGGTAEDLRRRLLSPTRHLLFIGHADATDPGGAGHTLGFTLPDGGLETINTDTVVSILAASGTGHGELLKLVFINGCCSELMGRNLQRAGVPNVVCWRTKAWDRAARTFSREFFRSISHGLDYRRAYEDGVRALRCATHPRTDVAHAPNVPMYQLCGPEDSEGPHRCRLGPEGPFVRFTFQCTANPAGGCPYGCPRSAFPLPFPCGEPLLLDDRGDYLASNVPRADAN